MARIAGVDIPRDKRVEISLSYIFGIGRPSALKICAAANVPIETKVRDLTDDEVSRLRELIDKITPLKASCASRCGRTSSA